MPEEYRINIMQDNPSADAAQQQSVEQKPAVASIGERLVALIIDVGVVSVVYYIFLQIAVRILPPSMETLYLLLVIWNIFFVLYETWWSCNGRNTLGKTLIGIRVADKNTGEPLGIARSFVRAIGYYVSAILLMCGFLLAFIDDKHRSLHDYLSGSVVLQARYKDWLEKTALGLVGALLMMGLVGGVYKQLFGAGSMSQQRLIKRAKNHIEKIAYLEDLHYMRFGYYTNDLLRLSILSGDPVQFQRDTQRALDNKGFRIGVDAKGYKIKARAKDAKKTVVSYPDF